MGIDAHIPQRSPWMQNALNCQLINASANLTCNIDEPAIFPDNCKVKCENFMPIADDFTVSGMLDGSPIEQRFIVTASLIGTTDICGNFEGNEVTTYQRMFDCLVKVQKSAGFDYGSGLTRFHPDQNCTAYDPTARACNNLDSSWFLVRSPSSDPQERFWLSPLMKEGNPALGLNQDDQQATLPPYQYLLSSKIFMELVGHIMVVKVTFTQKKLFFYPQPMLGVLAHYGKRV